jgi:hypothetical protein
MMDMTFRLVPTLLLAVGLTVLSGCGGTTSQPGAATSNSPTATLPTGIAATTGTAATTGSPPPTATATVGGGPAGAGAHRTDRCHTSNLSATLVEGSPGAGQRYAQIVLTNRSSATCTVYGYGGMLLLDAHKHALPTNVHRDPSTPPRKVTLAPGGKAHSQLHWTVIPGPGEPTTGPCEPTPAYLQVTPPDERARLTTTWSFGPVCQHGRIDQGAYRAGGATP